MSTAMQIDSRREVLSDQLTRGFCIDRLSRHNFSGLGPNVMCSYVNVFLFTQVRTSYFIVSWITERPERRAYAKRFCNCSR